MKVINKHLEEVYGNTIEINQSKMMIAILLIFFLVIIPVFTLNIINITGRTGNNGKKY